MKRSLAALSIAVLFGCNGDHPLDLPDKPPDVPICESVDGLPLSPVLRARAERVAELFAGSALRLDRDDLAAVDSASRAQSLDKPIDAMIAATTGIEASVAEVRAVAAACTAALIGDGSSASSSSIDRARLGDVDKLCRALSGELGGGPVGTRARVAFALVESAPFRDLFDVKQEPLRREQVDLPLAASKALGLIQRRTNELEAALVSRDLALARLANAIGRTLQSPAGRKLSALLEAISIAERVSAEFSAAAIMSTNECSKGLERAAGVWAGRARRLDNVRLQLRGFGERLQITPSNQAR